MKRTPQLTFEYDRTVEEGVRMSKLIDELAGGPTDLSAVAEAIRANDRFLLVTHENPDGDALGSIRAMKLALDSIGKDTVAFLGGEMDIPRDLTFMPLGWLERELPADAGDRVVLALDCATASRTAIGEELLAARTARHRRRPPPRQHAVRAAQPDRPRGLLDGRDRPGPARRAGVGLTPDIAEALYVALVTDTGRFQYSNTTKAAHLLAAELFDAGVDVERRRRVFQEIYESLEFAKLKLLGKALERAELFEGGRLAISYLLRSDFTSSAWARSTQRG